MVAIERIDFISARSGHNLIPRLISRYGDKHMNAVVKESKCPFGHMAGGGTTNRDWWPNDLRIDLLHQHSSKSDPMDKDFNYAVEF